MAEIHPTALVDQTVELAEGVTVGPYSIIQGRVKIGPDTHIGPHVVIRDFTTIGSKCEIFQFAVIGEIPQDLKFQGEETHLVIGDGNTIREFATLHRGTADGGGITRVGHGNLFMAYTHVAHDCQVGNGVIMSNNATLGGHITVGDHANLGGLSAVHQFCRIGRLSMIGGCSKVVQDVPPFMIADGNPAETRTINKVGLERNGVSEEAQNALRQAYKILFREGLTIPNALAKIEGELAALPEIEHLVQFIRASERGISK